MKVVVRLTSNFKAELKPLLKKYPSLHKDLLLLEKQLLANPKTGVSLGSDAYKIRLKITSKGKGKSGGARVITLLNSTLIVLTEKTTEKETTVHLLSIYDKSEVSTITDKELKDLIANFIKSK